MHKIKSYTIDDFLQAMENKGILHDGVKFKPKSQRMELFANKGFDCVTCGIKGSVFWLESHSPGVTPHLNLYAQKENGDLVLMTKDHIHPKSKGGKNELSNYQTMCSPCNYEKSDKV